MVEGIHITCGDKFLLGFACSNDRILTVNTLNAHIFCCREVVSSNLKLISAAYIEIVVGGCCTHQVQPLKHTDQQQRVELDLSWQTHD